LGVRQGRRILASGFVCAEPFIDEMARQLSSVQSNPVDSGQSVLLGGLQKQIVVPSGITLQFLLQKHDNILNVLQFILDDVDRINLGSREFR
jgi:hypothetical protein